MKKRVAPSLARLFTVTVALLLGTSARSQNETPATSSSGAKTPASPAADSAPPLTFAEAQKTLAATRRYVAHPSSAEKGDNRPEPPVVADFRMDEPPPAARAEPMPASPVAGYVWVPGHYMPVEGKWRWVRGEWAAPATPSSVWIPARYEPKEKKWTPGYWQPDRPPSVDTSAPAKDGTPATPAPYE